MKKEILPNWIYAVPRVELFSGGRGFNGFKSITEVRDLRLGFEKNIVNYGDFYSPEELEHNRAYKQVIPYCALLDVDKKTIFSYKRGKGEPRLEGKWSIGIGGHIHPIKIAEPENLLKASLIRRVSQEVDVGMRVMGLRPLGYINCEDSEDVDKYHIGILFLKEVYDCHDIKIKSPNLLHGKFRTLDDIQKIMKHQDFEDWSQISYKQLLKERLAD